MPATDSLSITISRDALREGLGAVAPVIASKVTLPILANILLTSTDDGIRLSGTDLDTTIHTRVAADVAEKGSLTVPAKRLVAIAKELAPAPCRISNGLKDAAIKLACGQASYRLQSLPESEFPEPPAVDFRGCLRIAAGDIIALAANTLFAASRDEQRPILNGVLWQIDEDKMRFVATNGHRLALSERTITVGGIALGDMIVPPKALAHMVRLFPADEELEVARNANVLGVRSSKTTVLTRLIEGPYPNYMAVIPKTHTREIRADRVALLAAVRRLVPVVSSSSHRLALDLKVNELELRADTPDIGDGKDRVPVRFEGEPIIIGASAAYLLDILNAMESDEIRIMATDSVSGLTFKPLEPKNRVLYILMPLRLID